MRLTGRVVKGQGFASIAFNLPTANLEFDDVITLEAGTYAAYTYVGPVRYTSVVYVGPQGSEKFETHLFDFKDEVYGQELEVEILSKVSDHVAWETEEQMKAKVANDVKLAQDYFSSL